MLRIAHSGLEAIPNMNHIRTDSTIISMIDFDSNKIKNVTSGSVKVKAENLILDHNDIEVVEDWSFHGSQIAKLSLKGNGKLRLIADDAFTGLTNLRKLDLSATSIRHLPAQGLNTVEVLKVMDTFTLKVFPSVLHFTEIKEAYLTYPYHCCAFKFPNTHDPREYIRLQSLRRDVHKRYCVSTTPSTSSAEFTTPGVRKRSVSTSTTEPTDDDKEDGIFYGHLVYTPPPDLNNSIRWETDLNRILQQEDEIMRFGDGHKFFDQDIGEGVFHRSPVTFRPMVPPLKAFCGNFARDFREVTCFPKPDAFNPCEDVMGQWSLRVAVWFVAIAAMFGNLAVLVVLLSTRSSMTVSKFLMCHLAFADFSMGLYLLIIACVDVRTMGTYFNYAIDWQHGIGCQIAGFLTVFSSELSIFTLTVITLERWYAITYAIHLNRRLQLSTAAKIMAMGWLYALLMATLPILGISGYTRTSICLPMENRDTEDLAYLIYLLSEKGIAFIMICTCYAKMYLSIRVSDGSGNRNTPDLHANRAVRSDLSVAKRMAMLVFTDFACWAPIAFFGLTAVAGMPLIDVTKSKILLVFFYPLNSCANPFLYAILTKHYRRDVLAVLSRWGICRRRSSCVHGRTLSTNIHHQRRVSSVKALYRGSLVLRGNQRQQVAISAGNGVRSRFPEQVHGHTGADIFNPEMKSLCDTQYQDNTHIGIEKSQDKSKEGSPAVHRGSPHPIKNSFTKVHHPDQQIILRRVLDIANMPTPTNGSVSTSQITTTDTTTTDGPMSCDDEDQTVQRDTAV